MSNLEVENFDIYFVIVGSLMITSGIIAGSVLPWAEETTHSKMGSCIEEMHFDHDDKEKFRECFKPNLEKIVAIQKLNALIAVLYSLGGIFIGFGVRTKLKSKKLMKKPTKKLDCNCNSPYRCPEHDN